VRRRPFPGISSYLHEHAGHGISGHSRERAFIGLFVRDCHDQPGQDRPGAGGAAITSARELRDIFKQNGGNLQTGKAMADVILARMNGAEISRLVQDLAAAQASSPGYFYTLEINTACSRWAEIDPDAALRFVLSEDSRLGSLSRVPSCVADLDSEGTPREAGRPPMKSALLEQIRVELRARLDALARAAMEAHAAATDPGSKAEGKYDTRSLEASYLALGQARQVEGLAEALRIFEGFAPPDFQADDPIDAGALVEVEIRGETSWFLLAPASGGLEVSLGGREITLLTPDSPLYQKLTGLCAGEELEHPPMRVASIA
jgi:hypothetical protein